MYLPGIHVPGIYLQVIRRTRPLGFEFRKQKRESISSGERKTKQTGLHKLILNTSTVPLAASIPSYWYEVIQRGKIVYTAVNSNIKIW